MSVSIVALPHGLNQALARHLAFDVDGLVSRDIDCVLVLPQEPEQRASVRACLTPCRLLARLFQSGKQNAADVARKQAIVEAETLVVLAGIGQFDDDVWTPVIARVVEAREKASTGAVLVFAWTGLEPFFLPYEKQAAELAANPMLTSELLPALERSAPSLAHLLRAARDRDTVEAVPQARIAELAVHKAESAGPALEIVLR
jgi:hypothetical protein